MNKCPREVINGIIFILKERKLKCKHFGWGFTAKSRWRASMFRRPLTTFVTASRLSWKETPTAICQAALGAVCHVAGSKRKFSFWETPIGAALIGPLDTVKAAPEILLSQLFLAVYIRAIFRNGPGPRILVIKLFWRYSETFLRELLTPVTFKATKTQNAFLFLLGRTLLRSWIFISCIWDRRQMANQN